MTARVFDVLFQPTLMSLKANLRITSSDLDPQLTMHLKAAITAAEHHVGQIIGLSSFTLTTDFARSLELEGPVRSITSVTVDGVSVASTNYTLKKDVLTFADAIEGEDVTVVYVAGMTTVPDDIKAAILLHAGALFNNPVDSVEALPKVSTNLLRPYRKWGIHD